ncbi:MAG: hypothetical protein ABEI86_07670 [Halobacteriaceae archaeon]
MSLKQLRILLIRILTRMRTSICTTISSIRENGFRLITEKGRVRQPNAYFCRLTDGDVNGNGIEGNSPPGLKISYKHEGYGRVTATLTVGWWFPIFSLLAAIGTISGMVFGNDSLFILGTFISSISGATILGYSGSLIQRASENKQRGGIRRHEEEINPIFLLSVFVIALFQLKITPQLGLVRYLLSSLILLFGMYIYSIQNYSPRNKGERFRYMTALVWFMPMYSSLISVIFLIQLFGKNLNQFPSDKAVGLAIPVAGVAILISFWSALSKIALESYSDIPIQEIRAQNRRRLWFILLFLIVLLMNVLLLLVGGSFISYIIGPITGDPINLHQALNTLEDTLNLLPLMAPRHWLGGYMVILFSPVLMLLSIWVRNLLQEWRRRRAIFETAEELSSESLGFDPKVTVYQDNIHTQTAETFPIWHRAESVVVIGRRLVEELEEEQLEAIYFHELYHVQRYHGWVLDILLAIGPILGGANATLPYWFPRYSETDADQYAAEQTDTETVGRALENIEELLHQEDNSSNPKITPGFEVVERSFGQNIADALRATNTMMFGFVTFGSVSESIDYRYNQL